MGSLKKVIWFVLCILVGTGSLKAQQRFNAGARMGLTAAQIAGDNLFGFNKLGLFTQLNGYATINDYWELSTALSFTQMGSKASDRRDNERASSIRKIHLNYAELGLNIHFKLVQGWKGNNRLSLFLGTGISRLLKYNVTEFERISAYNSFTAYRTQRTDIPLRIGFDYYFTPTVFFSGQYAQSMVPVIKEEEFQFRSFYLSFGLGVKLF